MSGTSASAAKAAGMASKVWESNPDLSVAQVIDVLTGSAIDLKAPGWDEETGFGVVNFNKAVEMAKETAPQLYIPTPFSNPTTWGLEGQVTPLERATADEFNGKYYEWQSYTLKFGDTLSQIALDAMSDASPDAYNWIAQHNNIPNANDIKAGATIEIPKQVSAPQQPINPGPINPVPINPPPPTSISLNGHTIGGNFYPVFKNYQGTLGNPTSDVINYNGMSYQLFEKGSIVSSKNGTFPLYGGIRQTFLKTGGLEGWLGAPKSGEKGLGNGNIIQYFENGYIYWNGSKATAYKEGSGIPVDQTQNLGNQPFLNDKNSQPPLFANPTSFNPLVGFKNPLQGAGSITQGPGGSTLHTGLSQYAIDYGVNLGTPVYAMRSGTVKRVIDTNPDTGGGQEKANQANLVTIEHDGGYHSAYLHLQRGFSSKVAGGIKPGDNVQAGQLIGYSGNSGWSTGPHLHVQVHKPNSNGSFGQTVPFRIS
jgi:murein DD-endopeptidase MepM/ murein hydrolase activator NlpD